MAASAKEKKASTGRTIRVTQVRSLSGRDKTVRRAVAALGLGRIGKSREFKVNPALAGIIRQVAHLVEVDEVK